MKKYLTPFAAVALLAGAMPSAQAHGFGPPAKAKAVRAASAASKSGAFSVGTNALNLGIGIGNRYAFGTGTGSSVSPALSASFERGILELGPGVLGVGAFLGYQGASFDYGSGLGKLTYTDIIVTVRGAFHYPVSEQFDAYGGVGVGIRRAGVSYDGNSPFLGAAAVSATGGASGLFVGGRYFFTSVLGVFAELGYDQTYLKAGLSLKF